MSVIAARSPECKESFDDDSPRLSTGTCAYKGFVGSMTVEVRLDPPVAGTAVGLAGRLGAISSEIESFELRDPAIARDRALAAAMSDARRKAEGIARASGVKLGAIVSADDDERGDPSIINVGELSTRVPVSRGLAGEPPVKLSITPQPVETMATANVVFAIER